MNKKILLTIFITMIMLVAPLTAISKPSHKPASIENKQDFLLNLLTSILERIQEKTGRTPPGLARVIERLSVNSNDENGIPSEDNNNNPEDGNDCDCDEFEGCSLGFWKNHLCDWECYTTEQLLKEVFEFPEELKDLENESLLEALIFHGGEGLEGKARILLKQAVAALLNAAHPDVNYSLNVSEVITRVNDTLASLNATEMEELKDLFDENNNLGSNLCGCRDDESEYDDCEDDEEEDEEEEEFEADAGDEYEAKVNETIEFEGKADGGVEPYNWSWDFGDGNSSMEQNPEHAYNATGTYTATLTVTDDEGNVATDTATVTIEEGSED